MIKIIPVLAALTVSSYSYDVRGAFDKPGISGKFSNVTPIMSISGIRSFVSRPSSLYIPSANRSRSSSLQSSSGVSNSVISSSSIAPSSSSSTPVPSSSSSKPSSSSYSSSSHSSSSSSSPSSSSSSSSSAPRPDSAGDYVFCNEYGPFTDDNEPTIDVTFTYELHSISSQSIIERVRLYKKGKVVSASSGGALNYTNGQRITTTFPVPIRNYWTSDGLQLRFEILNSSYSILKAYAVSFYPPNKETLSSYLLKQTPFTSASVGFFGDGSGLQELKDTFDFTNIGDYIDNDYYYRLDITRNKFFYSGSKTLTYKSVNLRFNDDDYLFPNFHHESNDDVIIPLNINQNGTEISFKYRNNFYVNKKTLDCSDTYQTGYILTSDFYLPINGLTKFNSKTLYLDFNEIGLNQISTSIPLRYELNRTIVGVCADGDYCVVGGN